MTRQGIEVDGDVDLVERFHAGSLGPEDLACLRFRAGPEEPWAPHPQVAFVREVIDPPAPLPGADLRWQQVLVGSPCGDLRLWHHFVAGRRVASAFGDIGDPDVTTTMRYDAVLGLMDGTSETLEAFEVGGHIAGEWSAMLLLLGISEQPEFVAAMRRSIGTLGPG
ncbi:MAG TPA: hypothetical protein VK507_23390, partial [Iamia sp.]|nr:hypothetical protein [Iamia sp.]